MRQHAIIVTDLGYGDAGKGATVDFLTRHYAGALIVRHHGGAQAAHNVVTPDGRHHTFAQFGSGMLHPQARTCLSRYMILDPLAMRAEAEQLEALGAADVRPRTVIDPHALVATPFQAIANRVTERARERKHGSCGCGIGETVADSLAGCLLRTGDLAGAGLRKQLTNIRTRQLEKLNVLPTTGDWHDYATLSEIALLTSDPALDVLCARYAEFAGEYRIADGLAAELAAAPTVIFEGAQGVLLDEWHGFHPFTTWSTTTDANARLLLAECGFAGTVTRLGVVRTYLTRHGAGPFVTESPALSCRLSEPHNGHGEFQGAFRCGDFDAVAFRYALAVNGGIDALAVTHADALAGQWTYCTEYTFPSDAPAGDFAAQGPQITAIRVNPHREDLARQQALTRSLLACRPRLRARPLPPGPDSHGTVCSAISELLSAPVAIVSAGRSAAERQVIGDALLPPVTGRNPICI